MKIRTFWLITLKIIGVFVVLRGMNTIISAFGIFERIYYGCVQACQRG